MTNSGFTLRAYGRTELAQCYFPSMVPRCAWRKLRSWLDFNPRLRHLACLRRRTFYPAEVTIIVDELGEP